MSSLWRRIVRAATRADDISVRVGIIGEKGGAQQHDEESGLTVAEIGMIHEFGTEHIPQRSWLLEALEENKRDLASVLRRATRQTLTGRLRPEVALSAVGEWAVARIKERIAEGLEPDLEESTELARTGDGPHRPLIDTARFLNAITFVVVDRRKRR